ncbi:MAG: putative 2-dehydropantoate 2-reductase, partial [Rhodospirillales bacterium]|nr:putative 2-dehydropantoate 2-reductase [Rhodospirillales bacterium]
MRSRSYAILGTGALGGYYGGRLANAGFDTHFLLRSDYEHVAQHGLRIDSWKGDFTLPRVNAYQSTGDMPRCDVVIIALKATDNHHLPELLPAVMKDDGVALLLQNGLGGEAFVGDIVGPQRVLGGLCFLCSNKIAPGHIHHLDYGKIVVGEHRADGQPGGVSERVSAIIDDLNAANIESEATEDLVLTRWKKLMWNVPFNGLCVLLRATTDHIIANEATRSLAKDLMHELIAGCRAAADRTIDPAFADTMIEHTEQMKPYKPSMMLDYENGRPMEVE